MNLNIPLIRGCNNCIASRLVTVVWHTCIKLNNFLRYWSRPGWIVLSKNILTCLCRNIGVIIHIQSESMLNGDFFRLYTTHTITSKIKPAMSLTDKLTLTLISNIADKLVSRRGNFPILGICHKAIFTNFIDCFSCSLLISKICLCLRQIHISLART